MNRIPPRTKISQTIVNNNKNNEKICDTITDDVYYQYEITTCMYNLALMVIT